MRLFVAIRFSTTWNLALLSAIETLQTKAPHAAFTRPENLHLTLAFIGNTERIHDVRAALSAATAVCPGKFSLTLAGTGRFGDVLWAGVSPSASLSALAENITLELRRRGFSIEKRHFQPHITLARHVSATDISFSLPHLQMDVASFSLMESTSVDGHLHYKELYRFSLSDCL